MKNERIYISGAISGLKRREYMQQFANVEQMLKARGFRVVNPTRLWPCRWRLVYPVMEMLLGKRNAYRLTLAYDLFELRLCDGLYTMWGSERSRGARLERMKARQWNIEIMTEL